MQAQSRPDSAGSSVFGTTRLGLKRETKDRSSGSGECLDSGTSLRGLRSQKDDCVAVTHQIMNAFASLELISCFLNIFLPFLNRHVHRVDVDYVGPIGSVGCTTSDSHMFTAIKALAGMKSGCSCVLSDYMP